MRARAMVRGIIILSMLLVFVPKTGLYAQETTPDPVLELMAQMSPEMKVGQLVLVSFPNFAVGYDSDIAALIRDYGVGGVLLRPQNGNFGDVRIAPGELLSITNRLQETAWDAARLPRFPLPGESGFGSQPYIPLLIAGESHVDGLPLTTFVTRTSPQPSLMALGATWDRAIAQEAGRVMGKELSALGINLSLGPDLNVLYAPRPGDPSDLGVGVFGGDPFWVGELGKAYIHGLHSGSDGDLLVVSRHLPGLGSADRPLEEEIPTVQKLLEQLKQIELSPFFAVSQDDPGFEGSADAFLVTHIRYRGFQGNNIRNTTPPISLGAGPLQSVMSLEELVPWRSAGGALICDNLGMSSVHSFYDPRGLTFYSRRVAQDALGAGNDLLVLDRFAADAGDWDAHFANVRDTLEFLAARYKDDPTFEARVDEAVYRVLSMKSRVYPDFSEAVAFEPDTLSVALGEDQNLNVQVALNTLTRISPSTDSLPPAPQEGDLILIFTQDRLVRWDADDQPLSLLSNDALYEALMRFYGPDGTGIVRRDSVRFFSFEQLQEALSLADSLLLEPTPTPDTESLDVTATPEDVEPPIPRQILSALREAQWIIFATTGLDVDQPGALALKNFLSEQANLVDARIVVLAFGPPYELDSTEISKLDLYYALYSPGDAFVDVGVRAIFRDLLAPGASPVDIPALDYYIPQQTMPDPNQVIALHMVDVEGEVLTQTVDIVIGDVVGLRTGVIVDRNGHPVPDGTPVQFVLAYPQEGGTRTMLAEAHDGIAETSITLERVGQLDITVQSEPALSSVRLQLTIRDEGPVDVVAVEPTPTPTPTPTLTPTPTPTPTPVPEPPKVRQLPDPIHLPQPNRTVLLGWMLGGVGLVWVLVFLWARDRAMGVVRSMHLALLGSVGSLGGYVALMAVSRWWVPFWFYQLVGREYLVGLVALMCGGVLFLGGVVPALWKRARSSS